MKLKRLAASAAALLFLAGLLSGCGEKQFDSVLTVDGEAISPAVYRMYQMQAYVQASQRVSSLSDTIGGVAAADWIYDTTVSLLRARRYYELEFEAQGLSFTEAERAQLETQTGEAWASAHAIYEKNGVDEAAYRQYQLTNAKGRKLFEAYCADLTDEQVKAYLEGHFVLIEYTQLPRIDSDGAALDEEGLSAVDRIAERALDELAASGGDADFAEVCAEAVADSFELGGLCGARPLLAGQLHLLLLPHAGRHRQRFHRGAGPTGGGCGDRRLWQLCRRAGDGPLSPPAQLRDRAGLSGPAPLGARHHARRGFRHGLQPGLELL